MHVNSSNQCYYTNNRFHFYHRWPSRQLDQSVGEITWVDEEDHISARQRLASQTGFTGLSILHRLHRLYKFDVLQDLVFDTMHTLVLRVLHSHLNYYTEKEYLRDPEVERRLKMMPWTAGVFVVCYHKFSQFNKYMEYLYTVELKNGRIPEGINRRMGYWKAEEFKNSLFQLQNNILGGIHLIMNIISGCLQSG